MTAIPANDPKTAPAIIPPKAFRRNLEGYIRSAKAGHDVVIGRMAPEVRLVRATTNQVRATESCQVAPDLLADLITSGAQAAASNVAEAQCAEGNITQALKLGLGDTVAKLLKGDGGTVWASLYFRTFTVTLHKLENATALEHISFSALLALLTLRLEDDPTIPASRWQELQDNIFGRRK
ncbi:hypothetical protein [Paenarthrobacter nicotinovorans]|uniref:hypothetical protein n=1 Tax=Paenarthrobacter nicotinovorans TaxID=29320 RepID=UPI0011AABB58|nr:hypothetical protein [Paenarthrobacter nicotinovorans]